MENQMISQIETICLLSHVETKRKVTISDLKMATFIALSFESDSA